MSLREVAGEGAAFMLSSYNKEGCRRYPAVAIMAFA
jgi:hypothetical protein